MASKRKGSANLLPESADPGSLANRIALWVTTVGRLVIVFTELVVIGAFLSRFSLDRKNSDLSEVIRQQKAILESTKEFEGEYVLLANRLMFIDKFYVEGRFDVARSLASIGKSTLPGVSFEQMSARTVGEGKNSQTVFDIDCFTYDEDLLVEYLTNLVRNPEVKSIEVKNISKEERESKYHLTMSVYWVEQPI